MNTYVKKTNKNVIDNNNQMVLEINAIKKDIKIFKLQKLRENRKIKKKDNSNILLNKQAKLENQII